MKSLQTLAFALFFCASQAEAQSAPAVQQVPLASAATSTVPGAALPDVALPPVATVPDVPQCRMAAAACFSGCAAGMVRAATGNCVPAKPASYAPGAQPVQALTRLSGTVATPPSAKSEQALSSPSCCLYPIQVTALGNRNLGGSVQEQPLAVDVRVNGQLVSTTPYVDALPAGDYFVEVSFEGAPAQAELIKVRPNSNINLQANFRLKLSPEQEAARTNWRNARRHADEAAKARANKESLAAERLERQRDTEQALADYQARLEEWQTTTRTDRANRGQVTPYIYGAIGGGGALVVAGVVLEILASSANAEGQTLQDRWRVTPDLATRAQLAHKIDDLEDSRNWYHRVGLTGLIVGGLAVASGVTLSVLAPTVPDAPTAPITFTPSVSAEQLGGTLRVSF